MKRFIDEQLYTAFALAIQETIVVGSAQSIMNKKPFYLAATVLLFGIALSLLTIGIKKDWRLVHEEDSAIYTTIALSHNYFGLRGTKFHDVFYDRHFGYRYNYSHHPPLSSIILALTFRTLHCDAPWVVRSVPIAFDLLSILLILILASNVFGYSDALLAGFLWAVIPMSSFFGRVFTQTTIASLPVFSQMVCYYFYKQSGRKRWAVAFLSMIVVGGLVDWSPMFISLAYGLFELSDWFRYRNNTWFVVGIALTGTSIVAFDLWHISYINHGNMDLFLQAMAKNAHNNHFTLLAFIGTVIDFYRRYFTHIGFISSIMIGLALLPRSKSLYQSLIAPIGNKNFERVLAIMVCGPLIHILASPSYSKVHHYWYFYFLPFVTLSMVVVWRYVRTRLRQPLFRAIAVVGACEILITTGHMLHLRHTKTLEYATETTKTMRRDFLQPCYLFGLSHTHENLVKVNSASPSSN